MKTLNDFTKSLVYCPEDFIRAYIIKLKFFKFNVSYLKLIWNGFFLKLEWNYIFSLDSTLVDREIQRLISE